MIMFKVEMDRRDTEGNLIEKGGVVVDKLRDVLGFVYNEDLYDNNGKRKKEFYKNKKQMV